jgi:hypothetical protein
MTTRTASGPWTVRSVLYGDGGSDPAATLARSLEAGGIGGVLLRHLGGLSSAALGEVNRQLAAVADGLLDLDVLDLVVGGWRKHAALVAAARRTLVAPGSEEVVDLVSHRIRSLHRPDVAILVDGVRVAKIDFELTVVFEVEALVAVVRAGRLVALRGGRCDLGATLQAEGVLLARQQRRFDLDARLPLGAGVELLAGGVDPPPPAGAHATVPDVGDGVTTG